MQDDANHGSVEKGEDEEKVFKAENRTIERNEARRVLITRQSTVDEVVNGVAKEEKEEIPKKPEAQPRGTGIEVSKNSKVDR